MENLTKMIFPEGYVCQYRENIMQLANMIGRKKPGVKPGEKGSLKWDDRNTLFWKRAWTTTCALSASRSAPT
jgi:hypothetical protein